MNVSKQDYKTMREADRAIERLLNICELANKAGNKEVEILISKPYLGEKQMRVIGDLFGTPVASMNGQTQVKVNVSKLRAKLTRNQADLHKEMQKSL